MNRATLAATLKAGFTLSAESGHLRYARPGIALRPVSRMLLLRHGETHINLKRNSDGWANSGLDDAQNQLTATGHLQAKALAQTLLQVTESEPTGARGISVVTSTLGRARQTAEPFIAALRQRGITPRIECDPALNEIDLGCWNNRLMSELPDQAAAMKRFRFDADAALIPPGGEAFVNLLQRAQGAMNRLNLNTTNATGLVLVFTHSTTISAIRMLTGETDFADSEAVLRWTGKGIAAASYLGFDARAGEFLPPAVSAA